MIPFINQFIRQWLPQSVNKVSKCQNLPWNVRSLWLTQSVNIARLFFVKKNAIPICVKFCVIIFLWNINPDDAHFPYIIVLLMNIFYYTSDLTFCSQTFQFYDELYGAQNRHFSCFYVMSVMWWRFPPRPWFFSTNVETEEKVNLLSDKHKFGRHEWRKTLRTWKWMRRGIFGGQQGRVNKFWINFISFFLLFRRASTTKYFHHVHLMSLWERWWRKKCYYLCSRSLFLLPQGPQKIVFLCAA